MASLHSSNIQNTALRKTENPALRKTENRALRDGRPALRKTENQRYETEELNFERRKTSTTIGGSAALR